MKMKTKPTDDKSNSTLNLSSTEDNELSGLDDSIIGIAQISFIIAIVGALLFSIAECPEMSTRSTHGLRSGVFTYTIGIVQSLGINSLISSIIESIGAVGLWYGLKKRLDFEGKPQTFFIILSMITSLLGILNDNDLVSILLIFFLFAEIAFSVVLITKYSHAIRNLGIALLASISIGIIALLILPTIADDAESFQLYYAIIIFGASWVEYKFILNAIREEHV